MYERVTKVYVALCILSLHVCTCNESLHSCNYVYFRYTYVRVRKFMLHYVYFRNYILCNYESL